MFIIFRQVVEEVRKREMIKLELNLHGRERRLIQDNLEDAELKPHVSSHRLTDTLTSFIYFIKALVCVL